MSFRNVSTMNAPELFEHGRNLLGKLENARQYSSDDQPRMLGATRAEVVSEAQTTMIAAQTATWAEFLISENPEHPTAEHWRDMLGLPAPKEDVRRPHALADPQLGDTIAIQDDEAPNGWRIGTVIRFGGDLAVEGVRLSLSLRDAIVLRKADYTPRLGALVTARYRPDDVFHTGRLEADEGSGRLYLSGYGLPLTGGDYDDITVLEPPLPTPAPDGKS